MWRIRKAHDGAPEATAQNSSNSMCSLWSDEVAVPAALDTTHEVTLKAESENPASSTRCRVFARLSITAGNILQTAGILAACLALRACGSPCKKLTSK